MRSCESPLARHFRMYAGSCNPLKLRGLSKSLFSASLESVDRKNYRPPFNDIQLCSLASLLLYFRSRLTYRSVGISSKGNRFTFAMCLRIVRFRSAIDTGFRTKSSTLVDGITLSNSFACTSNELMSTFFTSGLIVSNSRKS